eukprot:1977768-Prymnesium_polylepis.1
MQEPRETPMERAARERAEDADKAVQLAAVNKQQTRQSEGPRLFGLSAPQACESSFDCEAPL